MAQTPNITVLKDLMSKLESEFDLEARLNRYISNTPDLIDFGKNSGLPSDLDAARALFASDFILTGSEMPQNIDDENKLKVVIDTFLKGLAERNDSSDKLMRVLYLAVKTSSTIRRTDLFLSDRVLNREPSLIMLKDFYLEPYLELCQEVLGKGSSGWELSLMSALLKKTLITMEFEQFQKTPPYTVENDLCEFTWPLLEEYSSTQLLTPNTQITIPNVESTSTILVGSSKPEYAFSFWNLDTPYASLKDNQNALEFLDKYLGKTDKSRSLVFFRGRVSKQQQQFIIIRNPFITAKPFMIMRTPADEINLSEALTILDLRANEVESWKNIVKQPSREKSVKKMQTKSPETIKTGIKGQKSQSLEQDKEVSEKKGFFSKLFGGLFGKKSEDSGHPLTSVKQAEVVSKPMKDKKKDKKSKSKNERKVRIKGNSNLPYFISHSITASLVGDLDLFEIFDTYRESQYSLQGSFELDFQTKKNKMVVKDKFENPEEIGEFVNSVGQVLATIAKHFFDEELEIFPEEVLFVSENDLRTIICMEGNEDRMTGTLGLTFVKDIVDWRSKEEEILQRRTLHMRTSQLLQARRHTPLDEAIKRIYQGNLDENVAEFELVQKKVESIKIN